MSGIDPAGERYIPESEGRRSGVDPKELYDPTKFLDREAFSTVVIAEFAAQILEDDHPVLADPRVQKFVELCRSYRNQWNITYDALKRSRQDEDAIEEFCTIAFAEYLHDREQEMHCSVDYDVLVKLTNAMDPLGKSYESRRSSV